MTRINANIPPKLLSDHHLRAEMREILRIPRYFNQVMGTMGSDKIEIPRYFTLGQGHIKFFLNKGGFIYERYMSLCSEYEKRPMGLSNIEYGLPLFDAYEPYPMYWFGKWQATEGELNVANGLILARIMEKMLERMNTRNNYGLSYYGKKEHPQATWERLAECMY